MGRIEVRGLYTMRLKKIFYCILVLALVLTVTIGCGETSPPEPVATELVPQRANILGSIQVSEILNDVDLIEAYDKVEKDSGDPQTFEDALDQLVEDTGFDLRDFSEVVIFGDINTFGNDTYLGIIAKGTFNQQDFMDRLEDNLDMDLSMSDYKGYELYVWEEEETAFVFLSNTMVVFGAEDAVKDAMDVRKGDRKQVGDTILDTYNQLGDVLIRVVLEFSEELRSDLLEEADAIPEIPFSFEYLADVDTVGLSVNKDEETVGININQHFLSVDSAGDAYNVLSGAFLIFKGMVSDSQIKELLSNKIDLSIVDDSIKLSYEITLSEIEELLIAMLPEDKEATEEAVTEEDGARPAGPKEETQEAVTEEDGARPAGPKEETQEAVTEEDGARPAGPKEETEEAVTEEDGARPAGP